MRSISVCVDFHDILNLTLKHQHHHFHSMTFVTSPEFYSSTYEVTREFPNTQVLQTDLFYADGAIFNKYRALEWGLDQIGRYGWMCILDVDIIWPKLLDLSRYLRRGYLYSPLRHICDPIPEEIPDEKDWQRYPIHQQFREWAGYTQIFHADDERLGTPPWHDITWTHCGGGDSFLQAKWPPEYKIRPPWQCLHLGKPGVHWCGRSGERMDGSSPPESVQRVTTIRNLIRSRGHGPGRFDHEKIEIRDVCPMASKFNQDRSEPPETGDDSPSF